MANENEGIMLAEYEYEATSNDVFNAAVAMPATMAVMRNLARFFAYYEDEYDVEDFGDMVLTINDISNDFYSPIADKLFNKTPDQLTQEELYAVIDAMPKEAKLGILDLHLEQSQAFRVIPMQGFDDNGYICWDWHYRGDPQIPLQVSYRTDHGTAPDPVAGITITENHLPTLVAEDAGLVHTGWVDAYGDPVVVGQEFYYMPTLTAVWEKAPTAKISWAKLMEIYHLDGFEAAWLAYKRMKGGGS